MNGETANVLIIDSNISTSRTFKLILQKRGFQVVTAEDSAQALEKIKTTIFDAIVISLENPGPDSFDLLLFARKNLPNAARLVTIGFSSLETSIKALESGADAVFSKPVPPEEFVNVIKDITQKAKGT